MLANSIDEVIEQIDAIAEVAIAKRSCLGFFAALYGEVTRQVRDAILSGRFADGPRMERLDTVFACRYLDAYHGFHSGDPITKSWRVAFEADGAPQTIILQHLLLGMNAHINLDLGIAAAEVCPGEQIATLEGDFRTINEILAGMLEGVQDAIDRCSPMLEVLDQLGRKRDEQLACFSIVRARDEAWTAARLLARTPADYRAPLIELFDGKTAFLGRLIRQPGPVLEPVLHLVSNHESRDVAETIRILRVRASAVPALAARSDPARSASPVLAQPFGSV